MQVMQAEYVAAPRVSILDSIEDQFGPAPWWLISLLFHTVVILVAMMTVVWRQRPETPPEVFSTLVQEQEKPPEVDKIPPDPFKKPPEDPETEVVINEPEVEDPVETPDEMDMRRVHGDPDAISNVPLQYISDKVGWIGIHSGAKGPHGGRLDGGLKEELIGHWAPPDTIIPACDDGLRWLARHQEADGRWDGEKYEGQDSDAGITGLAALSFLAAGHTETVGKYKGVVQKAVRWMISQQDEDGCIGRRSTKGGLGYHHAICGLALAEAYGMSKRRTTGIAAQKAVDYSVNDHQVPYSGWRYNARQAPDTSVTGWFVMQLKSAKVVGLKVPGEGFQGAINWLDKVTDADHYVGRAGYQTVEQANHTLTAVGMTSRLFMGWEPNDPLVRGGAEYLLTRLPSWGEAGEGVNLYYWYYGSIAMFQIGGDYFRQWNDKMLKAILPRQRKGGDEDGSWDPVGKWCARGGRVYSTAMAVLCLEVYWKHLPMYRN